jgi:hypothetical protein
MLPMMNSIESNSCIESVGFGDKVLRFVMLSASRECFWQSTAATAKEDIVGSVGFDVGTLLQTGRYISLLFIIENYEIL